MFEENNQIIQKPFVSLSSDFGINSEGVGVMHGTILCICPEAIVVNLTHGIESFNVVDGARELETVIYLPSNGIHVCVVDPGVGSSRRALVIETLRGDKLIGPDNGVLIPASRRLGGIRNVIAISDNKYIELNLSRTFHGRDVFAKAAGWIARGVSVTELGAEVNSEDLVASAFEEAEILENKIIAKVLHINKFGSSILNVKESKLDELLFCEGENLRISLPGGQMLTIPRSRSFSMVDVGCPVLVPDDYGRVELAINMGSFSEMFKLRVGSVLELQRLL